MNTAIPAAAVAVTVICAVMGASAANASDKYTISSQSTSYTTPPGWPPPGWPNVGLVVNGLSLSTSLSDVNYSQATPILICTSGKHYNDDGPSCGDPGNASQPFGIGDSNPAIGIGVAVPFVNPLITPPENQNGLLGVKLMPGDLNCSNFSNHGSSLTDWWEYTIPNANPSGAAYTFSADVTMENDGTGNYYALLTNCQLN